MSFDEVVSIGDFGPLFGSFPYSGVNTKCSPCLTIRHHLFGMKGNCLKLRTKYKRAYVLEQRCVMITYTTPFERSKVNPKKNTSAELLDSINPYIVGSRGASQLGGIF